MNEKTPYVTPDVEVIEFVFEESIAESSGSMFYEDLWGGNS